jgi:hypothetical protein
LEASDGGAESAGAVVDIVGGDAGEMLSDSAFEDVGVVGEAAELAEEGGRCGPVVGVYAGSGSGGVGTVDPGGVDVCTATASVDVEVVVGHA